MILGNGPLGGSRWWRATPEISEIPILAVVPLRLLGVRRRHNNQRKPALGRCQVVERLVLPGQLACDPAGDGEHSGRRWRTAPAVADGRLPAATSSRLGQPSA